MSDQEGIIPQIGQPRTYQMRMDQISSKLSSKRDWYTFLEQHLQYYMLPYHQVTKDYLKDVLTGNKKFLKMSEVKFCNPPAYDEIGVRAQYEKVSKQADLKVYFPDKFPKGSQCDKAYMYNVWNTVHPEQVKTVIEYANSQRYTVSSEQVQQNSITITEEWQNQIQSMPFISKQKGRMSALLKVKSKIGVKRKERVQYQPADFMKRTRDNFPLANSQMQPQVQKIQQSSSTARPKKIDPTYEVKYDVQMTKP